MTIPPPPDRPIHIDRNGNWWFGERPVTHPRVLRYLLLHLEPGRPGRGVINTGAQQWPVTWEDVPLRVIGFHREQKRLVVRLMGGVSLPVKAGSLRWRDGCGLSCELKNGLSARFSPSASTGYILQYGIESVRIEQEPSE